MGGLQALTRVAPYQSTAQTLPLKHQNLQRIIPRKKKKMMTPTKGVSVKILRARNQAKVAKRKMHSLTPKRSKN